MINNNNNKLEMKKRINSILKQISLFNYYYDDKKMIKNTMSYSSYDEKILSNQTLLEDINDNEILNIIKYNRNDIKYLYVYFKNSNKKNELYKLTKNDIDLISKDSNHLYEIFLNTKNCEEQYNDLLKNINDSDYIRSGKLFLPSEINIYLELNNFTICQLNTNSILNSSIINYFDKMYI